MKRNSASLKNLLQNCVFFYVSFHSAMKVSSLCSFDHQDKDRYVGEVTELRNKVEETEINLSASEVSHVTRFALLSFGIP